MKKETLFSIIDDMKRCGVILDSRPDLPTAENLDADKASDGFPFLALFGTVLKPADVSQLLNSKITKIYIVSEDYAVKPAVKESAEEISGPETEDTPDGLKELSADDSVSPGIPLTAKATAEEMIAA